MFGFLGLKQQFQFDGEALRRPQIAPVKSSGNSPHAQQEQKSQKQNMTPQEELYQLPNLLHFQQLHLFRIHFRHRLSDFPILHTIKPLCLYFFN